ncbi:MAG: O-antigen ligase family protein, partial [Planctomycetota bacterium]
MQDGQISKHAIDFHGTASPVMADRLLNLAACLVALLIVHATWHFGGVTPAAKMIDAGLAFVLLGVVIAAHILQSRAAGEGSTSKAGDPKQPLLHAGPVLVCGMIVCVMVMLQGLLPTRSILFSGEAMLSQTPASPVWQWGSVLPWKTRSAAAPLGISLVLIVVSPIVFRDRQRRNRLLAAMTLAGLALVGWAFCARQMESMPLLPFMQRDAKGWLPFGPFVYKNAGAAFLIPLLAIASERLLHRRRLLHLRDSLSWPPSASVLFWITAAAIFAAGLLFSLSRGAWVASVIAGCLTVWITRACRQPNLAASGPPKRRLHWTEQERLERLNKLNLFARIWNARRQWALPALAIVLVLATLATAAIRQRVADLSMRRVAADSRWDHYPDLWATIQNYALTGSGWRTYGEASRPLQQSVHPSWYSEAHMQYGQVWAELGIFGLALLLAAMIGCFYTFARAARISGDDSESDRRWVWIGWMTAVGIAIQSIFDFVILIPAVQYWIVLILAIAVSRCRQMLVDESSAVTATTTRSANPALHPNRAPQPKAALQWHPLAILKNRLLGGPLPTLVLTSLLICIFGVWSYQAWQVDRVLKMTRLRQDNRIPETIEVETALKRLDDAIERSPDDPRLRHRRGRWHAAAARIAIVQQSRQLGQQVAFEKTSWQLLFVSSRKLPPSWKDALRRDLANNKNFQLHWSRGRDDFRWAVDQHPLSARYRIDRIESLLWLDDDDAVEGDVIVAADLSRNRSTDLFRSGILAAVIRRGDVARECFAGSLRINLRHVDAIYAFAVADADNFAPRWIAEQLLPAQRHDLLLDLVDRQSDRVDFAGRVAKTWSQNAAKDRDAMSASIAARLYRVAKDETSELAWWKRAVLWSRHAADFQYEQAQTLIRMRRFSDAIDVASLATARHPHDSRFKDLRRHAITEMSRSHKLSAMQ